MSYVGDNESYVGLTKTYVGDTKSSVAERLRCHSMAHAFDLIMLIYPKLLDLIYVAFES